MKVFALRDHDHAPEITEIAIPQPGTGEVRVRVHAASVNGFDLAVANGYLKGTMEHNFPLVLGKDFAGEVDAVGAEVSGFAVGDRVFGVVAKPELGDGSIGEYVTVPTAVGIAKLPEGVDFLHAAGLGLAGTAAVDAFDSAEISSGTTVLIAGATGGVGQQALQLAARAGAKVIATASSTEEIELMTKLGAAHTVDYKENLAPQVMALAPEGVDVLLHFAGDPANVAALVKSGGVLVSTILQGNEELPVDRIKVVSIYATPSPETLTRVARHQDEEYTAVTIQRVYGLDEATTAFNDFGTGTLGKLVISIV